MDPLLTRFVETPVRDWSLARLWRSLPVPLKQAMVEAGLEAGGSAHFHVRPQLLRALARHAGFREPTLASLPPAKVAVHAPRLPARALPRGPRGVADRWPLFRAFFFSRRKDLVAAYLEGIGLALEDGDLPAEADSVTPEGAVASAEALLDRFGPDDVTLLIVSLADVHPGLVPGLDGWLRERMVPTRSGADATEAGPQLEPAPSVEVPDPEIVSEARASQSEEPGAPGGGFTALDRLLIHTAVASLQEIDGAPDEAEVEDLVQEVLALNHTRHQSFFHRGFVDAVLGREWRDDLPAENAARRRWYAAGWLSGLARTKRNPEIVALLDERPELLTLVAEPDDAGDLALPLVLEALTEAERYGQAAALAGPRHLVRNLVLLGRFLRYGTELLRRDEAETARPFFDRLGEAVRLLEAEGEPVTERFFLEIRRRRAHCYRQLGDDARARRLLERLLEEEPDPGTRAMVLADLGLLDAGYRSLAEVRLWDDTTLRGDVAATLAQGKARFREALSIGRGYASHGAWPLGVLALARGNWDEARQALSLAQSAFAARPERYAHRNLLGRVTVAAGIALALAMEVSRLPRARDLLVAGLDAGGRIPMDLIPDVLVALESGEKRLASAVVEKLLEVEPEALDHLAAAKSARRTPAIPMALLARAEDGGRAAEARARDLRVAVEALLGTEGGASEEALAGARTALDQLEELAREGVARSEFLEFLERGDLDPAWSAEELDWARIALLEEDGRLEDAFEGLRKRFNAALASQSWDAEEQAGAILQRARSYDLGDDWLGDMVRRLNAWTAQYGEDEPPVPEVLRHQYRAARILIVGGDERQAGLEERVRGKLGGDAETLQVSHLATGWKGNWAPVLEEFERRYPSHDGFVLLRYMRTELGRSVRARMGKKPWVSCPGVGTVQVTRMVRKVAVWAAGEGV